MKAIQMNGGIGRIISALPALSQRHDIVITNGWDELYQMTSLRTVEASSACIGDYLHDHDIVTPEPYHLAAVRNGSITMAEGFHKLLGTDPSKKGGLVPNRANQLHWHKWLREKTDAPLCVIQPYGSGDSNPRDMSEQTVHNAIAAVKEAGYHPVIVGVNDVPYEFDCELLTGTTLTDLVSLVANSDLFVGGDSCGMHMASILDKRAIIVLTATAGQKLAEGNFVRITNAEEADWKAYPRFFTEEVKQHTRHLQAGMKDWVFEQSDFEEAIQAFQES